MTSVKDWQLKWNVSDLALADLHQAMVLEASPDTINPKTPEQITQAEVRVEAANKGLVLWRNNVGLAFDDRGNPIRFGLANDSAKMNRNIKSSDLIGIRPVTITLPMVGTTLGQFVAREIKRESWKYKGTQREAAQAKFLELILLYGGDAGFANGTGTL